MKRVTSTCIYCGCGCRLTYHIDKNKITKITGCKNDDISEGKPCIKGLTINEVFNKNRITKPLIRKNNKLIPTTWENAIDQIHKKISQTNSKDIFLNGSGKITNEDNFLLYKLGTQVFKTNNIDSCCGRLCHISTVKGINDCFGASNLTKMSYLENIDTLFIIGSNPAVSYPVFWNKVLKRKNKLKIISIQPILNITSKFGDAFLEIEPGTETALLNGIINYLIKNNSFIEEAKQIPNFKKLINIVKKYSPSYISEICRIKKEDFLKICELIKKSKKIGIFHGMNFTQHLNSLENVHSLMNLAILKNTYLLTLRGEINVQGVGDIFAPHKLNGNIIKSFILNPCKVAFITEFNPAQSLPDLDKTHKKLEKIFIVYFGSYFNKTCEFADVILPIPALFESHGTITNGEQRIRLVNSPIKTEKTFLQISQLIAKKFNKQNLFNYSNSKQIFQEIIKSVPEYNGINSDEIYKGRDGFVPKQIRFNKFFPEPYKGKDDTRIKKYPYLLTTFRDKDQFLTGEITSQSQTLSKLDIDKMCIYINPQDAKGFNLKDKDKIKIISKVGEIIGFALISDQTPAGLIATRFHYKEMLVNKLFPPKFDDITFTPNYKAVAVRIEKIKPLF
ncbi:MAG: molybdopterin-dependent oxidoreductase [archaeon]